MTASAHDIAAVLRRRLPGLGVTKLHKLLYYCQGHHLAAFDEPLFHETVSAFDRGPVVGSFWYEEKRGEGPEAPVTLGEAELNTIGYVLSRYGSLTGKDLENLTHSETPWQLANAHRDPGGSVRIEREWMRDYFRTAGAAEDEEWVPFDSDAVSAMLNGAEARRSPNPRTDDPEEIRARLVAGA